jgi:hypothetical protein
MTEEQAEAQVMQDYEAHKGKILLVRSLTAFLGQSDNQVELNFNPPIKARLDNDIDEDSTKSPDSTTITPGTPDQTPEPRKPAKSATTPAGPSRRKHDPHPTIRTAKRPTGG